MTTRRRRQPPPDARQLELGVYTDAEMASVHFGLLVERLGLLNRSQTRPEARAQVLAWVHAPLVLDEQAEPFSFQACVLWWNLFQAPADRVDPAAFQERVTTEAHRWQQRWRRRSQAA